jgi:hypothetical protein
MKEVEDLNREFMRFCELPGSERQKQTQQSTKAARSPIQKIDNRIVGAKCSACDEPLDLGDDVASAAEQGEKMRKPLAGIPKKNMPEIIRLGVLRRLSFHAFYDPIAVWRSAANHE